MLYTDYYFDKDFVRCLYEQHLFCFIPESNCADGSDFQATFLLWVKELSALPIVHLDQITQLFLWRKYNTCLDASFDIPRMTDSINAAWGEIILHPREQRNPALCQLVLRHIDTQYAELTLKKLSNTLGLNASYLSRVISHDLKCGFSELLQCRRILSAVNSLRISRSALSIESISNELGYSSPHYFYYVFKCYTGLTPAKAREAMLLFSLKKNLPEGFR